MNDINNNWHRIYDGLHCYRHFNETDWVSPNLMHAMLMLSLDNTDSQDLQVLMCVYNIAFQCLQNDMIAAIHPDRASLHALVQNAQRYSFKHN